MYVFTVNRLSKIKGFANKYRAHVWILKKYSPFILLFVAVSIIPGLLLLHGAVPVKDCIPYVFVYCLASISLLFYEVSSACLVSAQRTDILKFEGIIGTLVRIPTVLFTVYFNLGPAGFAISFVLDFACRVVYCEVKLHQVSKNRIA